MTGGASKTLRRLLGVAVLAASLGGCLSTPPRLGWQWFVRPDPADPWSAKIAAWQTRERATESEALRPPVSGRKASALSAAKGEDLRSKYVDFRTERKRELARDTARWIQKQAQRHYIEDGTIDHWATLEETLATNGDDCDGLELLVYHMLRDLGFGREEIYRAVVWRPSDGQHHMVTMWFEDREDPWVIDPTGAMTTGMPRMSQVPGWEPVKIFSGDQEYTALRLSPAWPASPPVSQPRR